MRAKPDLRVLLKLMIAGAGPVIVAFIRLAFLMTLAELNLNEFALLNIRAENSEIMELAYQHFSRLHSAHHDQIEVAPVACQPHSGWKRLFNGSQSVVAWLAHGAQISMEQAAEIINGFPIPVAKRLNQIAMNPCRFLGLASSISRSPAAIVFSTAGMDPLGFKKLHKYATRQFDGTLIHLDILPCEYCITNGHSIQIDAELQVVAE